jgi:hypothetical protein
MSELPDHGPGCRPLSGLCSARFPDEPRYVCTPNCPRRNALAREHDAAARSAAQPLVLVAFKGEGQCEVAAPAWQLGSADHAELSQEIAARTDAVLSKLDRATAG